MSEGSDELGEFAKDWKAADPATSVVEKRPPTLEEIQTKEATARHTIAPGVNYPHARYDQLVQETVEQIRKLSTLKGGEYAGDNDRLANFRRNAADTGTSMELVWRIYAAKHWDAIGQYIRDLSSGTTRPRLEGLSGRCDDIIVYMILFKAMLEEAGVK